MSSDACQSSTNHIFIPYWIDRVSVPPQIAIDIMMECNCKGRRSHLLVFCVNLEWQLTTIFLNFPYYDSIDVSGL